MRLGLVFIRNNLKEKGLKQLLLAYEQNPDDAQLLIRLGEFYLKDDSKIDEAETLLLKAISKDPEDADAHVALGKVYEKKEKVDEAIEQF